MTLALNEYKTSKKYGEKLIQVDKKLSKLIADYLKVQTTGYLLIDEKKMEPLSSHGITKRLHRITKSRIGKAIGSSMIRHSYLSHKYADVSEEMKKDSDLMGHSLSTQKMYIKK